MKIIKRRWFFRLLGILALVMVSGVMLVGCQIVLPIAGGAGVIGGIISAIAGGDFFTGVFAGVGIGAVIGTIIFIIFIIATSFSKDSSSSSSSNDFGHQMIDRYMSGMNNDPHTCYNCREYSSAFGKCNLNNNPKSASDSCSGWHKL